MIFRHLLNMQSHPTWVRGLKLALHTLVVRAFASHPTWVRGLKLGCVCNTFDVHDVAPYVGAWIETPSYLITEFSE